MDSEPEQLRNLGFLGILRESFKITLSWKGLFTKISLVLITPICFLLLAQILVSQVLFSRIEGNQLALSLTSAKPIHEYVMKNLTSEYLSLAGFNVVYAIFTLIFSLLATSAVIYTVACSYTAKDMIFGKVMRVVPNVWKRLIFTFLWSILLVTLYNAVTGLLAAVIVSFIQDAAQKGLVTVFWIMNVVLILVTLVAFVVLINITVVFHMAVVVSVMEEVYGLAAIRKSRALVKGKMWAGAWFYIVFYTLFITFEVSWQLAVSREVDFVRAEVIGYGVLELVLMTPLVLLGLVVMTVMYFVCKAYHNENIDRPRLSELLEAYLGYQPLTGGIGDV